MNQFEEVRQLCVDEINRLRADYKKDGNKEFMYVCEAIMESIDDIPLPKITSEQSSWKLFKQTMQTLLKHKIVCYLKAAPESPLKSQFSSQDPGFYHYELCKLVIAGVRGCSEHVVLNKFGDDFKIVLQATKQLTNNLKSEIGFSVGDNIDPEDFENIFFNRFFELAMLALNIKPPVNRDLQELLRQSVISLDWFLNNNRALRRDEDYDLIANIKSHLQGIDNE